MLVNKIERKIIDLIKKTFYNMAYGYNFCNFPEVKYKRNEDESIDICFLNDDYYVIITMFEHEIIIYTDGQESIFLGKEFVKHHGHEFKILNFYEG